MSGAALIIFTRYPEPGRTKTRMIPALGAEGAAALQRQMTEHTLRQVAGPNSAAHDWTTIVSFAGGDHERMRSWLGDAWTCEPQADGDLGQRMQDACARAFASGFSEAVVIGTDCPGLRAAHIAQALGALARHAAVFGPARDGGYYLVALAARDAQRSMETIFRDIPWGTPDVLRRTLTRLEDRGLTYALLDPLRDVDEPEDLPVWQAAKTG